jgi:hypothetical protein
MAGLREKPLEDRECRICFNDDQWCIEKGQVTCGACGYVAAENLVGESLEYANRHAAPLDANMRIRHGRVNGVMTEFEVKSKWVSLLSEQLTRMAHDKDLAIGEDIIKCAVEMVPLVEQLKAVSGSSGATGEAVRAFRSVMLSTRTSMLWALVQLAHDQCRVYTTLEDLNEILKDSSQELINVKSVNVMIKRLREGLKVATYYPDENMHVSMCVRRLLMSELRQRTGGLDRRSACMLLKEEHCKVMKLWEGLGRLKLNTLRFKVKADPKMLTQVYHACVSKKQPPVKARDLYNSLLRKGFDFGALM